MKSVFSRIRGDYFFPLFMVGLSIMYVIAGDWWYALPMVILTTFMVCTLFFDHLLEREIARYREAIDDALLVFEGTAWAKAYYKLETPKGKLEREKSRVRIRNY